MIGIDIDQPSVDMAHVRVQPVGVSAGQPLVAAEGRTGAVMRRSTLQGYGAAAGFSGFEVLPIDGFGFWRFYRLS